MKDDFSVLIQNRTEFENKNPAGVWLSLPATKNELHEAMTALNITADNPQDFFLNGYSTADNRRIDIPYEWVRDADLDKVNFLAARLEEMTPEQLEKLNAILRSDFKFDGLEQLIDYTYNTDYFVHIPDVYTRSDLGEYYLYESGMVQMPEAWKKGIDKEEFGSNAAMSEDGRFTDYGYILKSGDEWKEHYAGKDVPEQYRIMSYPEPEQVEKDAAPAVAEQTGATVSSPTHPIELKASKPAEKMKEITDRLEQGIQELFESERFKEYLKVMSKFHNYSFNNTLLIAMQKPDATLIAGYNSWKNMFGRQVMRGEKGIKVLAPSPYKIKQEKEQIDPQTQKPVIGKDGKPVMEEVEVTIPAFKVVSVFDVSQTEGRELPSIGVNELTGNVEQYKDFFAAIEKASPVPVAFEKIEGGAHGYYHLEDKRIAIDEGMSELQNLKTLIHEIAHAKLHDIDLKAPKQEQADRPDRSTREVQAESVAYAVCQYYGLDTSDYSFAYVATWSSGRELTELKASLETIRAAASELIKDIDKNFAELTKDKEKEQEAQAQEDKEKEEEQQEQTADILLPDPTISIEDMKQYGYTWEGMLPLLGEAALHLYENEDMQIFRLYEDGSESIIESPEDIKDHIEKGGILGVHKEDWNALLEYRAMKQELAESGAAKEALREYGAKETAATKQEPDTFTIYQLKDDTPVDYHFRPLDELREKGLSIDPANYEEIYTAPLTPGTSLGKIFEQFNFDRPEDFKGHSLSVSDVVVLHQNGQDTAHYVDDVGFADMSREFLHEPEAVFHLDGENYLYIQTTDTGIDYTFYDKGLTPQDGGQIDNPDLSMSEACKEVLAFHDMTPEVIDRVPVMEFERLPELIDKEPAVMIRYSEHEAIDGGKTYPLGEIDRLMERLDKEVRDARENPENGKYFKVDFQIESVENGRIQTYEGRQDLGDGDGSLIHHIQKHAEYYRNDPTYQNDLKQRSTEAWEQANAAYDATLQVYVPYLELHRNLSDMERNAQTALEENGNMTPTETAYHTAMIEYVSKCRGMVNQGDYDLPPVPKLADFDIELQEYKEHVKEEIAQEAAAAGMTVEEYAANDFEPIKKEPEPAPTPKTDELEAKAEAGEQISLFELAEAIQQDREAAEKTGEKQNGGQETSVTYYTINENAARRAKEMNSYSDYVPGSATADYRQMVDEAAEIAKRQKKRVDPSFHEKIDRLLDTYARKLAENMNSYYSIEARVPSILITGGGNFPVRKKEKQNAARDRNMEEWKEIQGLLDKIRSTGMGGISADDPQAVQKLESKLEKLEKAQETMKAVNAYYRKHKTLDGCPHISPERIEKLKAEMSSQWHIEEKPYPSWALSNNNAEIHRIKGRIEELTRKNETPYMGWEFDGGRVEANKEDNRLQIYFDEKPDEKTRDTLKENGFRWSPKAGAWQRQLNDNAIYAADRLSCICPLSGERPTEIQKKARAAKQEEKPSIRAQLAQDKEAVKAAPKKAIEQAKKTDLERS